MFTEINWPIQTSVTNLLLVEILIIVIVIVVIISLNYPCNCTNFLEYSSHTDASIKMSNKNIFIVAYN